MIEVTLNLEYKGKKYLTNVIVEKGTPQSQIFRIAEEQIKKQWQS